VAAVVEVEEAGTEAEPEVGTDFHLSNSEDDFQNAAFWQEVIVEGACDEDDCWPWCVAAAAVAVVVADEVEGRMAGVAVAEGVDKVAE
jgi:hypothetical protein